MPLTPPQPIVNQVLPTAGVLPYVQQQNFGQMKGQLLNWNPDLSGPSAEVILNNHIRKIYDRRTWYGLMIRGQIATTGMTIGGQVTITQGSPVVQGYGTSWTGALIGQQFRIGYNTPPMTIIAGNFLANPQTLTLELPWAGTTMTNSGYFIAQYYYSPGPNIKYIHTAINLLQAWRLNLGYNQQSLDMLDPWRVNTFSPRALAQMPPGVNGQYMVELWPVPSIVQSIPFVAVVQPPNLINDSDSIATYIRTDILVKFGIADAITFRGPKLNKYYDMVKSQQLIQEAEQELLFLEKADENLYRQNVMYSWEEMPVAEMGGGGGFYAINHGVMAGEGTGWGNGGW